MSKVVLEQIEKTKMLVDGLRNKAVLVQNKGLDEAFVSKLESDNKVMEAYNAELDKLKADLRTKTFEANRKMVEIKMQIREAKRIVKREFEQPRWKEFGIIDKR